MMTSRAEYRLLLRQDNADLRLSPVSYEVGLVPWERYEAVEEKRKAIEDELRRLKETWLAPSEEVNQKLLAFGLDPLNDGVNALQSLRRPEATYELIKALVPSNPPLSPEAIEQVTIEARYAGYIEKQRQEVERTKRLEERPIPPHFDYDTPIGLSNEAREKLRRLQPATVGQASRISGVNPTDISILLVYLERASR
jgi:tRNA uridine 5-carboxymethylaminomethyl modification enzyme